MSRFVFAGVIVVAALAGVAALVVPHALTIGVPAPFGGAAETAPVRRPLPPAITVTKAQQREFIDRRFVSGTLVARDEAMVGAQIDGLRIVELLAEDGDTVGKGQVLARLDRNQLDALLAQNDAALARADAAIAQARNQVENSEAMRVQAVADLARAEKLDAGIIAQATLDQRRAAARSWDAQHAGARNALAVAEADKRSREAERRELMVRIDRTDVKAPVAGLVSRRNARLGALAMSAGDALFRIIADGAIDLEADVPEELLVRLAVGMKATIALAGADGHVDGMVRLIASEVDKATRLGKVRIALPAEASARIGAFASGSILIARRSAVGVPVAAVTQTANGDIVEVIESGRVALRPIVTGVTNDADIEVRKGLAAGETVVARAGAFLRHGDEVRPVEAEGPRAAAK